MAQHYQAQAGPSCTHLAELDGEEEKEAMLRTYKKIVTWRLQRLNEVVNLGKRRRVSCLISRDEPTLCRMPWPWPWVVVRDLYDKCTRLTWLNCLAGIFTNMWKLWSYALTAIRMFIVLVHRVLDGRACAWTYAGERTWFL